VRLIHREIERVKQAIHIFHFSSPKNFVGFEATALVSGKRTDLRVVGPCASERDRNLRVTEQAKKMNRVKSGHEAVGFMALEISRNSNHWEGGGRVVRFVDISLLEWSYVMGNNIVYVLILGVCILLRV
jgi:hypothetical protein